MLLHLLPLLPLVFTLGCGQSQLDFHGQESIEKLQLVKGRWTRGQAVDDDIVSLMERSKRAASNIKMDNFPTDRPIPYVFGDGYSEIQKDKIRDVLKTFKQHSCVSFEENHTAELPVEFTKLKDACSSQLGDHRKDVMIVYGHNQLVRLGNGCLEVIDTIQHELFHLLGFDHTQTRPDRDDVVVYNERAADPNFTSQYVTMRPADFDSYGLPYEYNSVLHYSSLGTDNHEAVLTPKDPDCIASVGADHGPTFNDWKAVNIRYKCSDKCKDKIVCRNKGYQNSRNCTLCVCPIFYTGQFCDDEVNVFNLNRSNDKLYEDYMNPKSLPPQEVRDFTKYDKKLRVVKASEGQRIRITLNKIEGEANERCTRECFNKAVEIVDGDLSVVGKRFCCANRTGHSFVSKTNVVGYQAYSRSGWIFSSRVTFTIEPSAVSQPEEPTANSTTISHQTETLLLTTPELPDSTFAPTKPQAETETEAPLTHHEDDEPPQSESEETMTIDYATDEAPIDDEEVRALGADEPNVEHKKASASGPGSSIGSIAV